MKDVLFRGNALDQFTEWLDEDPKKFRKVAELIRDIRRNPFSGLGKPEALKHQYKGFWSRRIDGEHRLIYTLLDDVIVIIACKRHYEE